MKWAAVLAVTGISLLTGFISGTAMRSADLRGKRLPDSGASPPARRRKTSNVVLLVLGVSTALFIVAMTVIFCVKGSVPDTLIQCTLGAGGVEALMLARIKISKVRAGEGGGDDEDVP